jgi:polyhydroxyalkanoate synthase
MREQPPLFDFFAQCGSLIDDLCEFQRTVSDDLFQRLERDDAPRAIVDTATRCSRSTFDGLSSNPGSLIEEQIGFWQDQLQLVHNVLLRMVGEEVQPVAKPGPDDRRFRDEQWDSNVLFDYLKQSYLITAQRALRSVEGLGVTPAQRQRLNYLVRQALNAMAPSNFALTNPEILRMTLASNGENLLQGLRLLVEDRKRSADILNICTTAPDAFELGRDLACTPGEIVAETPLFQLIQYHPVTEQNWRTPVLLVPSWVNKYYIYDLSPGNSLVAWLLEQGHTVFCISWVNPDHRHGGIRFDDYMVEGVLAAAASVQELTGEPRVNAMGYCLGGILLACTAAYCDGRGDSPFAAVTYLAASMDFSDPGEMGMFVDEETVDALQRQMNAAGGYLDGRLLSAGFSLLKENDLYWNYYVQNYLKGERPPPLDLMHWNSDNTNVPAATHAFVMRELHLNNGLARPGGLELAGRRIDLAQHRTPTYVLATDRDHIARWRSCYAATALQGGEVRFVLAGSGHIAGVINPPRAGKYHYHCSDYNPATPEAWLTGAQRQPGSWWPDWQRWAERFAGGLGAARAVDPARCIEPAPGRYVRRRLDQEPAPARAAA